MMDDLLITGMNGLFLWRHRTKKQTLIQTGNYYGLTWNDETVYCSKNEPHQPVTRIEIFNSKFGKSGRGRLPMNYINGVHQILWDDGNLYITNTKRDRLDVYDGSEVVRKVNWTGYDKDRHHINSVWATNDKIYVAESGLAGERCPPAIQILDKKHKPIGRYELSGAIHIHNVYIENNYLYTCGKFGLVEQGIGSTCFATMDLRTDKRNGFFRGLARTKRYFYIGESQVLPRPERAFGSARVLVLNNDFSIESVIDLTDTGQIKDVRVVNNLDLAHNNIVLNI